MKVYLKRLAMVFLAFVMLFPAIFASSSINVQASTAKWKNACKAYGAYLAKNKSRFKAGMGEFEKTNKESCKKADSFLIVDLDKNGIPELVVNHPYSYKSDHIYVYTYRAGKIVQIKDTNGEKGELAGINISCQANGWYSVYKCKKNHLHVNWSGGMFGYENSIYTVNKGKLKLYAKETEDNIRDFKSYEINGRRVSSKKYNALVKKCENTENGLKSNTKTNRKKYLR